MFGTLMLHGVKSVESKAVKNFRVDGSPYWTQDIVVHGIDGQTSTIILFLAEEPISEAPSAKARV